MTQKRKRRDSELTKALRLDPRSNDYQVLLEHFEKPTQIYRHLGYRILMSPVFLNRNLWYMKERLCRTGQPRSSFSVNKMIETKRIPILDLDSNLWFGEYINITFLGFFNKTVKNEEDGTSTIEHIRSQTNLINISQSKRIDNIVTQEIVLINPKQEEFVTEPAIKISPKSMKSQGSIHENPIQSYVLLLKVMASCNKRIYNGDGLLSTAHCKKFYCAELVMFDKQRCLLTDGEYEIYMKPVESNGMDDSDSNDSDDTKKCEWDEDVKAFIKDKSNDVENGPMLKFRLQWFKGNKAQIFEHRAAQAAAVASAVASSSSSSASMNIASINHENQIRSNLSTIYRITSPLNGSTNTGIISKIQNGIDQNRILHNRNNNAEVSLRSSTASSKNNNHHNHHNDSRNSEHENYLPIVYQFIGQNARQRTDATDNFRCPWCFLNCMSLYGLLKHLKLVHSRFNFTYAEATVGVRIDVTINEQYDATHVGSPYTLFGRTSSNYVNGPTRRAVVTCIAVLRPRRPRPSLTEFLEIDENESNGQRPFITGHKRLYYHTMTCLPIHPKELDIDSEGESDPSWLRQKTKMMIDEFTDVNDGEKELMKMWNLHIMKFGYVGDVQIPLACQMFVEKRAKELYRKNLYRNFILHISNMFDYGLLNAEVLTKMLLKLQRVIPADQLSHVAISQARDHHYDHWNECGESRERPLSELMQLQRTHETKKRTLLKRKKSSKRIRNSICESNISSNNNNKNNSTSNNSKSNTNNNSNNSNKGIKKSYTSGGDEKLTTKAVVQLTNTEVNIRPPSPKRRRTSDNLFTIPTSLHAISSASGSSTMSMVLSKRTRPSTSKDRNGTIGTSTTIMTTTTATTTTSTTSNINSNSIPARVLKRRFSTLNDSPPNRRSNTLLDSSNITNALIAPPSNPIPKRISSIRRKSVAVINNTKQLPQRNHRSSSNMDK